MNYTPPHTGRQLAAARALLNITQDELAQRAGLHVNSVYNLEQQEPITAGTYQWTCLARHWWTC